MGFGSKVRMSFGSTGIQNSYRFWSLITTCTCACVERLNMFQQAARSGSDSLHVHNTRWSVSVSGYGSGSLHQRSCPQPTRRAPDQECGTVCTLYSTLLQLDACIHAPTGHTFNFVQATFDRSVCKTQPVLAISLNVN